MKPGARVHPVALVAVLALVLAAVIALAPAGGSVWASPRRGEADRLAILLSVLMLFAVGLAVAGVLAVALHRMLIARRPDPPPLRITLARALPAATVALVALSLWAVARTDLGPMDPAATREYLDFPGHDVDEMEISDWFSGLAVAGEAQADPEASDGGPAPDAVIPLLLFLGAVAAAVGVVGWWYVRSRRGKDGDPAATPDARAAHASVVGMIDAMLMDPDPRRAIIGAYARLLEGLAAWGTPRRSYEGPMEHLQRALATLEVRADPSRRLVDLFEVARFSTHPLTPEHREQALDALREVAADLAAPPDRPPPRAPGVSERPGASGVPRWVESHP